MADIQVKRTHVAGLIKLAKADGVVKESEVGLIKLIAIRMGLSSSEFNDIVTSIDQIEFNAPESLDEKKQFLYDVFQLMKVDLSTDDSEQEICQQLGLSLGFEESTVMKASRHMSSKLSEVVSRSEFDAVVFA